jgi:hypothetical protein
MARLTMGELGLAVTLFHSDVSHAQYVNEHLLVETYFDEDDDMI